jgi:hypothetical protein
MYQRTRLKPRARWFRSAVLDRAAAGVERMEVGLSDPPPCFSNDLGALWFSIRSARAATGRGLSG